MSRGTRGFALNTAFTMGAFGCKMAIQAALIPVMARLLGPDEYGIYALALPTVLFFQMLADGGLGVSLSQESEDNDLVWSSAFWLLIATCSVMAVAVTAVGFGLAHATGQPRLAGIMALLSLSLPIMALTVTSDSRLNARGNMAYHSMGDVASTVAGAVVAVTLANAGAGAWSLAAQYLTAYATRCAILVGAGWVTPSARFDMASLKGHVSTGGALLVSKASEAAGWQAQNALYGTMMGTPALGDFSLGQQVSRFMCDAVGNPVIGSFYVHALSESPQAVVSLQRRMTRILATVLLPAACLAAVGAPVLLPAALGPKWAGVVPLFQALVLPYGLATCLWLGGQIIIRHGLTGITARASVAVVVARIAAVAAGSLLGPVWVAWLIGLSYVAHAAWLNTAVPRGLAASVPDLARQVAIPAAAAGVATVGAMACLRLAEPSLVGTVGALAVGGLAYVLALAALDMHGIRSDVAALTGLVRRRRAA